jgi:hypothetical protein
MAVLSETYEARCTRHKDHLSLDIKPGYPAIGIDAYQRVCRKFHLPPTYRLVRTHANASGAVVRSTVRGNDGSVERLGK